MLSIFPSLLAFEGFAPLLLRLTIGAVFALWAYGKLKKRISSQDISFGVVEAIIALGLILGVYTQLAALAAAIILGFRLIQKIQQKAFLTDGVNYYLILFIISLTLLLTGPGFFAFDLPL
ncbi:MAG: hypothetical protein QG640_94 [Patescibacteria group bacterium]|nr:hypothetical protein [Patescibacteria group bacterium]